jgi:perosamine synthetase
MQTRKGNAAYLTERFKDYEEFFQLPHYPEYIDHSFMMYPIVVKETAPFSRKEITHFLEHNNIESRPMLPLLNQPIYIELFGDIEKDYPVAQWINNNGFYIGCHHGLNKDDLEYIVAMIAEFIQGVKNAKQIASTVTE